MYSAKFPQCKSVSSMMFRKAAASQGSSFDWNIIQFICNTTFGCQYIYISFGADENGEKSGRQSMAKYREYGYFGFLQLITSNLQKYVRS